MQGIGVAELPPMTLRPLVLEKVWGGRRLARWGKTLPGAGNYGESWEIADLSSTTQGGGGGAAARTLIEGGPMNGRSLQEVVREAGASLLGGVRATRGGEFPLLVKFLDAREHLSVQVHPSAAYAAAHPGAHLKTECWYVLEAEPVGGKPPVIFTGLKPGVTRAQVAAALSRGEGEGIVPLLRSVEARVGDCHTLPSGTLHALGAGVLVAEVQTPSDTTFRVYDWTREYGRARRAMHKAEAMECIDFASVPPAPMRREAGHARGLVSRTAFFEVWSCQGPGPVWPGTATAIGGSPKHGAASPSFVVVMALSEGVRWKPDEAGAEPQTLARGRTLLVPAAWAVRSSIEAAGDAEYLLVTGAA